MRGEGGDDGECVTAGRLANPGEEKENKQHDVEAQAAPGDPPPPGLVATSSNCGPSS